MRRFFLILLIFIYLFPNLCLSNPRDEIPKSFKVIRLIGSSSTEVSEFLESVSSIKEDELPSWCTTAICIGFGIMGVVYILGQISSTLGEFNQAPREFKYGCCTGILLGAIFAYVFPLDFWDRFF